MLSAIIFYATTSYGIVFDYGMIQNTIETDSAEVFSYINFYAFVFIVIFGVVPSVLIYRAKVVYKTAFKELLSRTVFLALSIISLVIILITFYSNYAAIGRNNKDLVNYITPYKMFEASYKYIRNNYFYAPLEFKVLDRVPTISHHNGKNNVMVLVLGETARAQNFSLNGYSKPTNKHTNLQNIISFSNMSSCGTATAVSVPCMFSRLNKADFNKRDAKAQQNVIDIIHLSGADVLWISNNNGGCKDVCTRVQHLKIPTTQSDPLCDGEYCFDEILLRPLRNKLNNLTYDNTLIVLHMIGSHGPTYFKRYPADKRTFFPDCQRSDIQNCSQEQLVNTYDNTIAYTDFVLSKIVSELNALTKKEDILTSMLYVSDHGESLGEKGVYLHGIPYAFAPKEQTHIPMLFWTSKKHSSFNLNCLNSMADNSFSHDNVFDTLLSIMSVKSNTYNREKDAFIECKIDNDYEHFALTK
jgi:lipid A ethanolaminephosphotransferase